MCSICPRPEEAASWSDSAVYGSTVIPDTDSYKHLTIVQSASGKHPFNADRVKQTIRGTFMSITGMVSGSTGRNSSTSMNATELVYYRALCLVVSYGMT